MESVESDPVPYGYVYEGNTDSLDHLYTVPALLDILKHEKRGQRIFDAGCGNGVVAAKLAKAGYDVTGVDLAPTGIENANKEYPELRLEIASLYDDLAAKYGHFPVVICMEVVEHLFHPKVLAKTLFNLTEPGGTAIVSTPYHGYWKNLAIAVTGKFDFHVKPLWDYGHIKFFSMKTLTELLQGAGFAEVSYRRIGRIPCLAWSMIAIARRPMG